MKTKTKKMAVTHHKNGTSTYRVESEFALSRADKDALATPLHVAAMALAKVRKTVEPIEQRTGMKLYEALVKQAIKLAAMIDNVCKERPVGMTSANRTTDEVLGETLK